MSHLEKEESPSGPTQHIQVRFSESLKPNGEPWYEVTTYEKYGDRAETEIVFRYSERKAAWEYYCELLEALAQRNEKAQRV